MIRSCDFPKYLLKINGKYIFLSFTDACAQLQKGMEHIEFGDFVISEDFSVTKVTEADKSFILECAEIYSVH